MRVRVVDRPLTEYQRYELVSYGESQTAGEQILLVARDDVGDVGVDFWLFDPGTEQAHAVLMHYHPDGSVDRFEPITDPATLAELNRRRHAVLELAVPLNEFLVSAQPGHGG